MIAKKYNCLGIKLFKFGKYQAYIWFCPKDSVIKEHTHNEVKVRIIYLFGRIIFSKDRRSKLMSIKHFLRSFIINPQQLHAAIACSFSAFITFEKWLNNSVVTNLATNIKEI